MSADVLAYLSTCSSCVWNSTTWLICEALFVINIIPELCKILKFRKKDLLLHINTLSYTIN